MRRLAAFIAVGLGAVLGYAMIAPQAEEPAAGVSHRQLIAELPEVGRLTWRCDDEGRFSTILAREGATVFVTVRSDGKPVWMRRQLDPGPPPNGRLATPFAHIRRQTWRIRWYHEPATVVARVRIRFGWSRAGGCVARRTTTDVRTSPH